MSEYIEYIGSSPYIYIFNMRGNVIPESDIIGALYLVHYGTGELDRTIVIDTEENYERAVSSKVEYVVEDTIDFLFTEKRSSLGKWTEGMDEDEWEEYRNEVMWKIQPMLPPHTPEFYLEEAEYRLDRINDALELYYNELPLELNYKHLAMNAITWRNVPKGAKPFIAPKLAEAYEQLALAIQNPDSVGRETVGALLMTIAAYLNVVIKG